MNIEEINTFLGEWQIDSLIGQGSYGKVYRVKTTVLSDTYYAAVKVISIPQNESEISDVLASGESEESVQSYFKGIIEEWNIEIRMLERLKGVTNIVGVEDYRVIENADKIHWDIIIRMEYLTPFNKYVLSNPIRISDALKIGLDICKGLEYCEHQNIIHRDIKPENIFVSKFGDFKLGDFGIARQLDKASTNLSKKGTNLYMAPEVYKGESYSTSVDIYSLGLVLYRLFNQNKLPFIPLDSATMKSSDRENSIVQRMKGLKIPNPVEANETLSEIILKACAYDANARYQSATLLKKDLQNEINKLTLKDNKVLINIPKADVENAEFDIRILNDDAPTADLNGGFNTGSNSDNTSYKPQVVVDPEPVPVPSVIVIEPDIVQTENDPTFLPQHPESVIVEKDVVVDTPEEEIVTVETEKDANGGPKSNEIPDFGQVILSTEPKGKKNKILIFALLAIVLMGSVFGFMLLNNKGTVVQETTIAVPHVLEMNGVEAKKELEKAGFVVVIVKSIDNSREPGKVINQSVESNKKIKAGSEITITISEKATFDMPLVVNMDRITAKSKLELLGAKVTIVETVNDTKKEGVVISQSIAEKTKVESGTVVKITVIVHTVKVSMPFLINLDIAAAKNALDGLGLRYTLKSVINDSKVSGQVFAQSIAKNTQLKKGTIVVLSFYIKTEKTTVPAGTATAINTFKAKLTTLKLEYNITEKFSDSVATGLIISISPVSGTVVNVGTSINIIVSKGPSQFGAWALTLPAGITATNYIIESQVEYRSQNKLFSESDSETMAGYTKYNEQIISYGAWSAFTEGAKTATKYLDVNPTPQIKYRVYHYARDSYQTNCGTQSYWMNMTDYPWCASQTVYREELTKSTPFTTNYSPCSGSTVQYCMSNGVAYSYFYVNFLSSIYINSWNARTGVLVGSYPYTGMPSGYKGFFALSATGDEIYYYQTRVIVWKFYFWKASGVYTNWTTTAIATNDNILVEKRTLYRYREK